MRATRNAVSFLAIMLSWCLHGRPAHADACVWQPAQAEIDQVLEANAQKAAEFRKLTSVGRDSLAALLSLATEAMRKKIEDCSYEAGEYLTKKGFPPLH